MRGTMQEYELTVPAIVRHGVQVYGDSCVVTRGESGARRASFATLWERASRLAHGLQSLGVADGTRVATFLWNNQEHVECYLAIPSMGAVLHTLNLRLFVEQLVYVARHAGDEVVVVDGSLADQFAPMLCRLDTVRHVVVTGDGAAQLAAAAGPGQTVHSYSALVDAAPEVSFPWPEIDERSAAAMCYTSGTTGDPKGVVYTHRSTYLHTLALCNVNTLAIREDDRILPVVPMFHANGWGLIYAVFFTGADLVLTDRRLQSEPLVAIINEEKPTVAAAVPTIWNDLAHFAEEMALDLSSIRVIFCGGSQVSRSLMECYRDRYNIPIIQGYGLTETSPMVSLAFPPRDVEPGSDRYWDYRETQGRIASGVEARVCGVDGTVLPRDPEAVGEIELRGPWVAGSYYQQDDPAPFHDGWLRTGDIGSVDDRGYVRITDRAKDVIKSGGEWISSLELESLLASHDAVLEVAVIGVPDARWDERPLACVVLRPGCDTTLEELRDHLEGRVARWQVPQLWARLATLPRTSVEKFDKKVLKEAYAKGEVEVTVTDRPRRRQAVARPESPSPRKTKRR